MPLVVRYKAVPDVSDGAETRSWCAVEAIMARVGLPTAVMAQRANAFCGQVQRQGIATGRAAQQPRGDPGVSITADPADYGVIAGALILACRRLAVTFAGVEVHHPRLRAAGRGRDGLRLLPLGPAGGAL